MFGECSGKGIIYNFYEELMCMVLPGEIWFYLTFHNSYMTFPFTLISYRNNVAQKAPGLVLSGKRGPSPHLTSDETYNGQFQITKIPQKWAVYPNDRVGLCDSKWHSLKGFGVAGR